MPDAQEFVDRVGAISRTLTDIGVQPILVGGMALVMMGSRRVTGDFDFVIEQPGERLQSVVDVFYEHELELTSRLNADGDVTATIDNPRVAAIRLRLDKPDSAFFFDRRTGLRVDVLFDFPTPARTLAEQATPLKVRSHVFTVASEDDLLQLKRIARAKRDYPGDAQDIAFLEARRRRAAR